MALSRDQILAANDLLTKEVHVKQWGGVVILRTLTAGERDQFEADVFSGDKPNLKDMRARLVALTVVDEQGNRLFTYDDVKELRNKSAAVLNFLFEEAQTLNRMNNVGMEEAEKN